MAEFELLKSGAPVEKNWRTINEISQSLNAAGVTNAAPAGALARLREVGRDHQPQPFRIYGGDTWLEFKVAAGYLVLTGDPIVPTDLDTAFTLTAGVARYWFYLEISSGTAVVKKSSTTLAWSGSLIPLGWVDTTTGSPTVRPDVEQLVHDHIFNPCLA